MAKLGEMLIKKGLIKEEQLAEALKNQEIKNERVGINLLIIGAVGKKPLLDTLSEQLGIEYIDLENIEVDNAVIQIVPKPLALRYKIMPIKLSGFTLIIASSEPLDMWALKEIEKRTGYECEAVLALETEITHAIKKYYG